MGGGGEIFFLRGDVFEAKTGVNIFACLTVQTHEKKN